jgi:hypothetical protein
MKSTTKPLMSSMCRQSGSSMYGSIPLCMTCPSNSPPMKLGWREDHGQRRFISCSALRSSRSTQHFQNVRGYLQVNETVLSHVCDSSGVVQDNFLPHEYSQSLSHHLFCTRMTSSRFPVALLNKACLSPDTHCMSIPIRSMLISRTLDGNMRRN